MLFIENRNEILEKSKNVDAEDFLKYLQPDKEITIRAGEVRSCCPAHGGEGKENFSINQSSHEWICHSQGCKGSNLIDLLAKNRGIKFNEAVEEFAKKYSIEVKYRENESKEKKTEYTPEDVIKCWENASSEKSYLANDTYFSKKKLSPPYIARYGKNPSGYLSTLIPYNDIEDKLQFILSLSKDRKLNYGKSKGAFASLGDFNPEERFYIGEGIATVQTAWEATKTAIPAISCGSCNNIMTVLAALKDKYKNTNLNPIVLIDCDKGKNGLRVAKEISKKYPGATFRKPDFSSFLNPNNEELADFNDLISLCNFPLEEVERQLSIEFQIPKDEDSKEEFQKIKEALKENSKSSSNYLPIISIADRQKNHETMLAKNRGKKYLGLKVKTIKEFNTDMLGIRGLQLLAAAPNVGKTALTIQLALEILSENPEACLIYISLEMSEDSIFTRMNLYHSELNFNTYVLGSTQIDSETHHENLFTAEELRKIELSKNAIEKYGDRLQIIDQKTCPNFNSDMIIAHIQNVKKATGCTRAIVIVDYLQVWPIPENKSFSSDIEADKWRIGEIKKINDALNIDNHDPVIVISEARKPEAGKEWGGFLSDVMGSARQTYTPDAVLLLSQLEEATLAKLFEKMHIDKFKNLSKEEKPITSFLAQHGMAFCGLKLAKGRDGMTRFNATLVFHFRRNKFETINWSEIRVLK